MISWDAFVRAMSDAGFLVKQSGGSAVSFEKDDSVQEGQNGRIVFHRPHPEAKIDPVIFLSMGKRMHKWFGWDRDTFSLAKPKDAE